MADFDPLTIPAVMPATVRRFGEGGMPSQALLDYEQLLQAWMKANTANINQRLTAVESETDANTAQVEQLAQALTDGTGAYGAYITSINTKANNATANGQIYLAAMSGPSGSTAAYGFHLTAGGAYAGMQAIALSGGGSAIGFTANQFLFTDSGTGLNVFSYSGGFYVLTGNVRINGNLVVAGSTTSTQIASGLSFNGMGVRGDVVSTGSTSGLGVFTDYASVTVTPANDGRLIFMFKHVGTSIVTSGTGPVTSSYRVVRRKGGDTVMAAWDITGTAGYQMIDFFQDTVGSGTCQYVLQHCLTSVAGSATLWTNNSSFFRIVVFGADR